MSQQQQRQEQIEGLKRRFQRVYTVRETPQEVLLQVDHTIESSGQRFTVYAALDGKFPRTPPKVACFGGRAISIAPLNENGDAAKGAWNPQSSQLADAVENAFTNLAILWGSASPPVMDHIAAQLQSLSDQMLQDIITNPSCLESYAHQLPYLKSIREASRQSVDEIERVARENIALQPEVESLQKEVAELQQRLAGQVEKLQKARTEMPLLNSVGSPELLAKTFASDVKELDAECEGIAKRVLEVDPTTDRRGFDDLMDEFASKAKQRHIMDLKRRAYHASLNCE